MGCRTPNSTIFASALNLLGIHAGELLMSHGYAVSEGEITPSSVAVAVPVYGSEGQVVAALSIAGPQERMNPVLDKHTAMALACARLISDELMQSRSG